ncbi:unnamed protein product, partial [Polarella glacialis]
GAADRRSSRLPGTSLRSVVLLALGALATAPLLGAISRNSLPAFAAGFAPLDRTSWRAVAMHAVGDADVKAPAKASATAESAVQQVTLQEVPEQSASQVTLQEVENPELKKEPVEEGKRLRQFLALEPLDEEQDPSGGNHYPGILCPASLMLTKLIGGEPPPFAWNWFALCGPEPDMHRSSDSGLRFKRSAGSARAGDAPADAGADLVAPWGQRDPVRRWGAGCTSEAWMRDRDDRGRGGRARAALEQDADERLQELQDDPRQKAGAELGKAQRAALGETMRAGRNSASFDPASTLARPSMRVCFGSASQKTYGQHLRHDDIVVVPDFFCTRDDWQVYYDLLREMRDCQAAGEARSEWQSWHEGAHLLSQNPEGSATYQRILDRICEYFSILPGTRGTRFNWYRDGADWKPFHHDSAAFNADRAKRQNCTVGISFGASRELAFRHSTTGELIYFPQTNGMLFFFGRDVNLRYQHGINALPAERQDGKGRISIILWGWCGTVEEANQWSCFMLENMVYLLCFVGFSCFVVVVIIVVVIVVVVLEHGCWSAKEEEAGSPPMLVDESRGVHSYDGRKSSTNNKSNNNSNNNDDGRKSNATPCRDFARDGRCSFGDRCRFSHDIPISAETAQPARLDQS